MRRLVLIACLAALLAAGTTTTASASLKGGVGDQNASTFSDSAYKALHVKRTRVIFAYDAIFKDPGGTAAWMNAAKAAHLEPLVAFNPSRGTVCPGSRCKIPSLSSYKRAFSAFHKKYKNVKYFQFWNETNSATQPTGPTRSSTVKKTAQLYLAAKKICGRRCTVTGPDILDQGIGDKRHSVRARNQKRMLKWVGLFLRYAGKRNYPKIWGLHNYGDTNYFRSTGTRFFLHSVAKHGQVWATETGGDYFFRLQSGQVVFKPSASRQAKAVKYAYTIAHKYQSRIKRLYYYQWQKNNSTDSFDAGIRDLTNGTLRPAYTVLKKLPKSFWR